MALQTFTAGQILTAAQMTTLQANAYNQTVSTKTASYVLVAADRGTRIAMNLGTATTITVNSGLFTAGDTLFIQNIGAGTCTITAGTCTVTTAGSLALAQWGGGTLYFTSASAAIFFSGGVSYGVATGGTSAAITVGGVNYTRLVFTASGSLVVSRAGLFDLMMVGGGGGANSGGQSNGGGAGGLITTTVFLPAATYTVTIGAGGTSNITPGTGTSLGSVTVGSQVAPQAVGGGAYLARGANGYGQIADIATTVSPLFIGQGNSGGAGTGTNGQGGGGGGGGGAAGGNGTSVLGGTGGAGYDASVWRGEVATTTYYAGGGGGGINVAGTRGLGGVGGGGNGGQGATAGVSGTANTGGGGGGSGSGTAGQGGSGIFLVRFKI